MSTPRLLACIPDARQLPNDWPAAWGRNFVIKALGGYNSRQVMHHACGMVEERGGRRGVPVSFVSLRTGMLRCMLA